MGKYLAVRLTDDAAMKLARSTSHNQPNLASEDLHFLAVHLEMTRETVLELQAAGLIVLTRSSLRIDAETFDLQQHCAEWTAVWTWYLQDAAHHEQME